MSQENLEAARRLWQRLAEAAASGRADVATLDALLHPEAQYREDPRWPGSGVYRGQTAIQTRFDEYLEILGPMDLTLHEAFESGDAVVVVFGTRGETRPTGLPFEHEWAWLWTFHDGRLTDWRAYFEKDEALEAAGLEG